MNKQTQPRSSQHDTDGDRKGSKRKSEDITVSSGAFESTGESPAAAAAAAADTDLKSDELILEWSTYEGGGARVPHSISVDEFIAGGVGLAQITAAQENETGEWKERGYALKLMGSDEKELSRLNFVWWADSSRANLMNFNQKSQDLANLSATLWRVAGRKQKEYSGMAIEFGESRHSRVEVNELIFEALHSGIDSPETTYLDLFERPPCRTKEQGHKLINGLIALVGQSSSLIAHTSDLDNLQVGIDALDGLDFEALEGANNKSGWYIRTADDE